MIPGIPYCWTHAMAPMIQTIMIECKMVLRSTRPSWPCNPTVETPVVKFWGEIILDVTAPVELVDAIKIADKPISLAATTCKLPNNELEEVSLPDKKQAIQPSQADKKGNALPTEANVKPTE